MCGIAGWLTFGTSEVAQEVLGRMLETLRHRGPDETGRYQAGPVCLGMTRLSINDLEGGGQPYFSEDRSIVAVFNGEIYNFRELRRELELLGHRFRSQTDGEVIVHLWEEYGRRFVERLNGMFAIALWDGDSLYLFRDRVGIKPLYYSRVGGTLFFASELKALVEVPGFSQKISHSALTSYLNLEYVPSPLSIYQGAAKLCPGHSIRVSREGGPQDPDRYWQLPRLTADGEGTLDEWAQRLRGLLLASVKRRLLSDVPLGVFLSGGLDSSSLTALMTELNPGRVQSFSIGFSEKTFDESSFSNQVAKRLGTHHHVQVLEPVSTLDAIGPLYAELDEPLGDAAIIPTYLLSVFARKKVTVALSGEGADELLGGYPTYLAHQLARPFAFLPSSLIRLIQSMAARLPTSRHYLSLDFKIKRFVSGLGLPDAQRHLTWMGSIPPAFVQDYLIHPHQALAWSVDQSLALVERIQDLDFRSYLAEDLLVKLDRATMLTSLEGRVPFLDHELLEGVAKLPTRFKFRGLDAKRVLKHCMRESLPDSVIRRNKKGFGIPLAEWLRGPLKFLMDEHLSPDFLRSQGLFRPEPIERMVRLHLEGRVDYRKPLWTFIVFQMWWKRYRPVL